MISYLIGKLSISTEKGIKLNIKNIIRFEKKK